MHDHRQRETLITLAGAGVRSGGRVLVEGVDLTISRGEIVTLIGPNGSGKSTLTKTLLFQSTPLREGRLLRGLRRQLHRQVPIHAPA